MKIKNYKQQKTFKNPHKYEAVMLYDKPDAQIIHMKLDPGDKVKKHKTPVNVSFFIIEGNVLMKIGNQSKIVDGGSLIESPANIPHEFENNNKNIARVLVIKHPRP